MHKIARRKTFSISAYIEALVSPQGRSPRLERLYPTIVYGHSSHRVTREAVVFTLTDGATLWRLTIPLDHHFGKEDDELPVSRTLRSHCLDFLAEAHFLSPAITLFDQEGRAYPCDGLLQREYMPLMEFVRTNCAPSRRPILRFALESLAALPLALSKMGVYHGALTHHNMTFGKDGKPYLLDYPIVASSSGRDDALRLGEAAMLLYIAACDVEVYKLLAERSTNLAEHRARLEVVGALAEYYGINSLAVLAGHLRMESPTVSIAASMELLACEPFKPIPLLGRALAKLLGEPTEGACECCRHFAEYVEPESVDFDLCDEVIFDGEVVRYRRAGIWGYALPNGTHITTHRLLLAAYEFVASRAVVRTSRGYGLMDITGRMYLNDVWENLFWHSEARVVTACNHRGEWHIYDDCGQQLSRVAAEWMGDCSEGYLLARKGKKYGFYSVDGTKCTDFIYDEAYGFSEGLARVAYGKSHYFIDTNFRRISPHLERLVLTFGEESEASSGQ